MIRRLTQAIGAYPAGQLVTSSPSEVSETVRLIDGARWGKWRKLGALELPIVAAAKVSDRMPADPVKPTSQPDVGPAKAEALGAAAKRRGLPISANPYRSRTPPSAAWRRGWNKTKSPGGS